VAGLDHGDTVIRFDPVPTQPGDRLAFEVADDEPAVDLAVSLRPTGDPAGPVFWDGTRNPSQAVAGRTNRAVSGYVGNLASGC
jgi:hypothetical protein